MESNSVLEDDRRSRDRERKRRKRSAQRREYWTRYLTTLIANNVGCSVVTLTYDGDIPPFCSWRSMFHSYADRARRLGYLNWAVGVPHPSSSKPKVRGDIHVLCDLASPATARLDAVWGRDKNGVMYNRSTAKLPPALWSLADLATKSGFGPSTHCREANAPDRRERGTVAYVLSSKWNGRSVWTSNADGFVGGMPTHRE